MKTWIKPELRIMSLREVAKAISVNARSGGGGGGGNCGSSYGCILPGH